MAASVSALLENLHSSLGVKEQTPTDCINSFILQSSIEKVKAVFAQFSDDLLTQIKELPQLDRLAQATIAFEVKKREVASLREEAERGAVELAELRSLPERSTDAKEAMLPIPAESDDASTVRPKDYRVAKMIFFAVLIASVFKVLHLWLLR